MSNLQHKSFYDREYASGQYNAAARNASTHGWTKRIAEFVDRYSLQGKPCLEIGAGAGAFQDIVADYFAIDITTSVVERFHKPFSVASATELPFKDSTFDAIWTVNVLEHISNPELALAEMRRVLKPGSLLFLAPAWYCRSWAADGYEVRPYSDFGWHGKIIKASIPVRDSVLWRAPWVFVRRALRICQYLIHKQPVPFHYHELQPNYTHFWISDSDAVNSIDPFDAILWFVSRGDHCQNFPTLQAGFRVRSSPLVFRIMKSA